MVSLFLKAEFYSLRFGDGIAEKMKSLDMDRRVVEDPDLTNEEENAKRRALLGLFRGYGKSCDLFWGFPQDVRWHIARLTKEEMRRVKYIEYGYWAELSGGTRFPVDAAQKLLAEKDTAMREHKKYFVAADAVRGGEKLPLTILVSTDERGQLVILEGHLRTTAMMLAYDALDDEIDVVVGFSPSIHQWSLYGGT